jgi:hypothetical protein
MSSEGDKGGTDIPKWMTTVELVERVVDEMTFKKVVLIDRRIEMRSKSELFATRDPAHKKHIDKQNELRLFRISRMERWQPRQKNHK